MIGLLSFHCIAERVLLSRSVRPEWLFLGQKDSGTLRQTGNGVLYIPPASPKEVSFEIGFSEKTDYRLFNRFELEIASGNEEAYITVDLQSAWPLYGSWRKQKLKLKKGTEKYSLYLIRSGRLSHLRQLNVTVHCNKGDESGKGRSAVKKPIEIKSMSMKALSDLIPSVRKDITSRSKFDLPPGLSAEALRAADDEKKKLERQIETLTDQLQSTSATEKQHEAALGRLFDLRNEWQTLIQAAALRKQAATGPIYGWTGGADKIFRNDLFPGTLGGTVKLGLARNESEGVQISIFSLVDLKDINVHAGIFRLLY